MVALVMMMLMAVLMLVILVVVVVVVIVVTVVLMVMVVMVILVVAVMVVMLVTAVLMVVLVVIVMVVGESFLQPSVYRISGMVSAFGDIDLVKHTFQRWFVPATFSCQSTELQGVFNHSLVSLLHRHETVSNFSPFRSVVKYSV